MSDVEDQELEPSLSILSESRSSQNSPEQEEGRSGGNRGSQVLKWGRVVVEVIMWSVHNSALFVHDGARGLSILLYKSCILFGHDCWGYWRFIIICHQNDYDSRESCTTYFQWREEGRRNFMSWKALLVDGPILVGQTVYPAMVEVGQDILIPTTIQLLRLVGEISILLCQLLFGIIITLTPWAFTLLWPERRHKSSGQGKFAVVGHPCEVGHSFGYHIDISDDGKSIMNHDDSLTAVSEITNDEAIRSPAAMVRGLCGVFTPDGHLLFPFECSQPINSEMLTHNKTGTEKSKPNTSEDSKPTLKLLRRHPMVAIRSKWKKSTTGLKDNGLSSMSTKLRRSLLKQKIV
mmetsp:Transcript_35622/g.86270  ORF Transcript_35622/g.86270 Transcript_35622/m.86270 type:complete len:348 (-) Transcript_35622:109-1152(-)|eukprot:CAMPEP_0113643974 /NCGR_PEP_ID=MMETSP0017_2-20120614/23136_1 /TAXON_ID=2856 /ORGANISM="Cylindrotheca closterium" /LENGTH=347 /DNA_ID=CAMNT_0000555545 /DNA_START=194 /DNA_END=1237 /DNA_ORIENTATION=- /assembly_acc=CAM_ASM_000147